MRYQVKVKVKAGKTGAYVNADTSEEARERAAKLLLTAKARPDLDVRNGRQPAAGSLTRSR